jgi:hypothetical protein
MIPDNTPAETGDESVVLGVKKVCVAAGRQPGGVGDVVSKLQEFGFWSSRIKSDNNKVTALCSGSGLGVSFALQMPSGLKSYGRFTLQSIKSGIPTNRDSGKILVVQEDAVPDDENIIIVVGEGEGIKDWEFYCLKRLRGDDHSQSSQPELPAASVPPQPEPKENLEPPPKEEQSEQKDDVGLELGETEEPLDVEPQDTPPAAKPEKPAEPETPVEPEAPVTPEEPIKQKPEPKEIDQMKLRDEVKEVIIWTAEKLGIQVSDFTSPGRVSGVPSQARRIATGILTDVKGCAPKEIGEALCVANIYTTIGSIRKDTQVISKTQEYKREHRKGTSVSEKEPLRVSNGNGNGKSSDKSSGKVVRERRYVGEHLACRPRVDKLSQSTSLVPAERRSDGDSFGDERHAMLYFLLMQLGTSTERSVRIITDIFGVSAESVYKSITDLSLQNSADIAKIGMAARQIMEQNAAAIVRV